MRWPVHCLAVVACALAAGDARSMQATASGPPLDRLNQLGPYLAACVTRTIGGVMFTGQRETTFSISFRRDGTLFGEPLRTHSFPAAHIEDQTRFLRLTEDAIRRCAPLPFSKELGEAIAGRPYRFHYIYKPKKDIPA
jgi:hypothetical protein